MKVDVEDELVERLRKASLLCGCTPEDAVTQGLTEFCENREYMYSKEGIRRFPYVLRRVSNVLRADGQVNQLDEDVNRAVKQRPSNGS